VQCGQLALKARRGTEFLDAEKAPNIITKARERLRGPKSGCKWPEIQRRAHLAAIGKNGGCGDGLVGAPGLVTWDELIKQASSSPDISSQCSQMRTESEH